MAQAKDGDTVDVHYKGTLDDGTVFDSSDGREPLRFEVGAGQVIAGFDEALRGMSPGETKSSRLPADQAYGERRDELVFQVGRDQLEPGSAVNVGDHLRVGFPDGRSADVEVTALDDQSITLDANHPLAGKALTFELRLIAIV